MVPATGLQKQPISAPFALNSNLLLSTKSEILNTKQARMFLPAP